jgi:predicted RND superfamily exporter protein
MINIAEHKKLIALLTLLIGIGAAAAFGVKVLSSQTKELKQLREQRKEIYLLRDEYLSLRDRLQSVESRKNSANVQGVLQAVDEVFSSVGMKDKVKTVKSTGRRETKEGIEEEADVFVEKVTMNEMVNIFYRIEHAPMILTVRRVTVKQSFDSPDFLNMTLMLSFLKTRS